MYSLQSLSRSILKLHETIRDTVVDKIEKSAIEDLAGIERETESDTIYAVDRVSEDIIIKFFEDEVAFNIPIVLIAEGLTDGKIILPRGSKEEDAIWRVIVDPIDGTRGLMYQKRSAWILTGVAPNRGSNTNLLDIELAVQTEIPLVKQHLSDVLWTFRGKEVQSLRFNRLTGESKPLSLKPSTAATIAHGFVTISRFFPGAGEELAAIEEGLIRATLGPIQRGKAHSFEDQYISNGGQLYELMAGHDRFIADLRPLVEPELVKRGTPLGLCAHPYDLCTELIARQLGVIITDCEGNLLSFPLDITTDVNWIGYANPKIREQTEPLLQNILRERGLLC